MGRQIFYPIYEIYIAALYLGFIVINVSSYQHLRFKDDFNCADFAKLVASDYDINYPIGSVDHKDKDAVVDAISNGTTLFDKVNSPRDFDLIYIRESDGRRHIGLYFSHGKIFHLPRTGSPLFQKITSELSGRIIGYFRLKENNNA